MRTRASLTIHAALALSLGGVLYLALRSPDLPIARAAAHLGTAPAIEWLRAAAGPLAGELPAWVTYSLPSALWCYAFTLLLAAVWRGSRHPERWLWGFVPLVLAAGIEIGQLISRFPGTPDPLDVVVPLIAWATAVLFARSSEVAPCTA